MPLALVGRLVFELNAADDAAALHRALSDATKSLGFDYFSLSYGKRPYGADADLLVLHDYPDAWATIYAGFELARVDPVQRASERTMTGFAWRQIESIIPLTRTDRQIFSVARENGIGDGYTVPRHVPGEASGSCTFVVRPENDIPEQYFPLAEIVGAVAIDNARRLVGYQPPNQKPILSERQRECVLWSARGKTAGEIAQILGISEETVNQHLKLARERYDVHSRQTLIICAMFDGLIGFGDIFGKWTD